MKGKVKRGQNENEEENKQRGERKRRYARGKKGKKKSDGGVWGEISARFVEQLSWGTSNSLKRRDENKRNDQVTSVEQRFPFRATEVNQSRID